MSATRNPYYQLPGRDNIPGDVRVSDTADATKTAADESRLDSACWRVDRLKVVKDLRL